MESNISHNRPSYVVPSSVAHGIKVVHPMFRGYSQQVSYFTFVNHFTVSNLETYSHSVLKVIESAIIIFICQDSQEFLRCFMDQLHEELKSPVMGESSDHEYEGTVGMEDDDDDEEEMEGKETDTLVTHTATTKIETNSQSDTDYETCDSGLSSERSSVEHSIASGDEGTVMDAERNSLHSQTEMNTSSNANFSETSSQSSAHNSIELDRDSAISSSMSSVATNSDKPDKISVAKSRKESENIGKKQSHGAEDTKDNLVVMDTGNFSDSVAEMEPLQKGKMPKTRNPSVSSQKNVRSRQISETDKMGRARTGNMSQGKKRKQTLYRSVVSDIFDGKILSSVQCLTCERVGFMSIFLTCIIVP